MIRKHSQGAQKGKVYFVGCSSWTPGAKISHKYVPIPTYVDEAELAKLVSGGKLKGEVSTRPCARVLRPRQGGGTANCGAKLWMIFLHDETNLTNCAAFVHMNDGVPFTAPIIPHHCPAARTIFVPLDPAIRKVVLVQDYRYPHSHPILPMTKTTLDVEELYTKCVEANGAFGSTVAKVEKGA